MRSSWKKDTGADRRIDFLMKEEREEDVQDIPVRVGGDSPWSVVSRADSNTIRAVGGASRRPSRGLVGWLVGLLDIPAARKAYLRVGSAWQN